jgi:hypothetical protein
MIGVVSELGRKAGGVTMSMESSHIWLGRFGPQAPASYFEEQHEDDAAPRSQFCSEQGEKWCDYDFVEISFLEEPESIESLVDGHSYSESYLNLVKAKAAELGIVEANVFVLADKGEFDSPRTVSGAGYHLWYLGEFGCTE